MANEQMIDFPKKYKYKIDDVDVAHDLMFERARTLMRAVQRFNETVKQAEWMENHRPEVKKLRMSDGSVIRGEDAENTWSAFNDNDWNTLGGVVAAAKELGKEFEEGGLL